jgi:hypothetical protein
VRATNGLHSGFRKAEVSDFALLNQILHGSGNVFNWNLRIDAVLIEQINYVGPESLERGVSYLLDVLRPAIHPDLFPVGIKFETELGCYNDLVAEGR